MDCNPSGAVFEGLKGMHAGPMTGMGEDGTGYAPGSFDFPDMMSYQAALLHQQQQQQLDPHVVAQFQQIYLQQQQQQMQGSAAAASSSSSSMAPTGMHPHHHQQQMLAMQHMMMMGGGVVMPQAQYNFMPPHQHMFMPQHHQQQHGHNLPQKAAPLPARPSERTLPQLPNPLAEALFGSSATGPQEFDWASKFSAEQAHGGAAHMTDSELAGQGVQTLGTFGEPPATYEDKAALSEFNKLMGELNSGTAHIDEAAGTVVRGGEDNSDAAKWARELAEAQRHVDGVYGEGGTQDPSQLTSDEKFLRELEAGHGDLEGNDPTSQGFFDSEFAFGPTGNNTLHPQQVYQDGGELGAASVEAANMASAWDRENLRRVGDETELHGDEHGDGVLNEFDNDASEWIKEYQEGLKNAEKARLSTDYPFDADNPYLFHEDPFTEGLQMVEVGAVAEAVLCFEAACQQQDRRQEAWRQLGLTQAENEKDGLAILALNKAKELDPKDVQTHMALAVSHANEANYTLALESLKSWLFSHREYEALQHVDMGNPEEAARSAATAFSSNSGLAGVGSAEDEYDFNDDMSSPPGFQSLFLQPAQIQQVTDLFHAATEINPMDHDVHVCMGIVGCLAHDYQMGIDSFKRAVEIKPTDARIWNKLGATLANGNRSEEAIEAYNQALDINPGYVRARHNMGVAYNNLGDHAAAAKHLVQAIHMQQGGTDEEQATLGEGGAGGAPRRPRSTREMWDVLRMSLNLMRRQDLVERSWSQDIRPFLQEFGLEMH